MRCIVVGNSPDVQELGSVVDDHDIVIRTGYGMTEGFEKLVGNRTDMLVTRTSKFNSNNEFKYQITVPEENKPRCREIIFLSNHEIDTNYNNILSDVDQAAKLNINEKPTLGLIAVVSAVKLYNKINVYGIETQIASKYHSHGHTGDVNYRRDNSHHSLAKEVLYYNKMIRCGIITNI